MKRYLYLWHRWLGIGLCLLMALWFGSGVVMLYIGYPKLTSAEHFSRLPALELTDCCIEPQLLLSRQQHPVSRLRLSTVAGQPRYLLTQDGQTRAFDARSGDPITTVGVAQALASARQFAPGVAVEYQGLRDEDTWTHSRGLDADRPLHRLLIKDAEQRLLYVSSASGAVVRDATARERLWNWVGAWLHWLYPLRGNAIDPLWHDLVVYLSLSAMIMALLGIVVGLLRWRFGKPYRSGSRSPYPRGWARWHHIGGLLFGTLLIAWVFSGLMSMRPWGLLSGQSQFSTAQYQGGSLQQAQFGLSLTEAVERLRISHPDLRELEWRMLNGEAWLVGYDGAADTRLLALKQDAPVLRQLDAGTLLKAAEAALPDTPLQFEWLESHDVYYLERAEQSMYGNRPRPLPALRVRYQDSASTWVYIDPYTGAALEVLDRQRRINRWLFNFLHSWDLPELLNQPLLREVLLIAFSAGGMVISLSGVVLGWRRLRRS